MKLPHEMSKTEYLSENNIFKTYRNVGRKLIGYFVEDIAPALPAIGWAFIGVVLLILMPVLWLPMQLINHNEEKKYAADFLKRRGEQMDRMFPDRKE